jgi:hypothetical protein
MTYIPLKQRASSEEEEDTFKDTFKLGHEVGVQLE